MQAGAARWREEDGRRIDKRGREAPQPLLLLPGGGEDPAVRASTGHSADNKHL